jgi:methionyl-tRNA formyltransferase
VKIVFMGTTSFGIPALDALSAAGNEIRGIVSTPGTKKGRGLHSVDSDMTLHARKSGYHPVLAPESLASDQFVSDLKNLGADLFVVVAFRILPQQVFSIPVYGTYNIHASLLPKYRGPAPIQRALEAGETETGITVFRIDAGIDTGTIVLQKKTPVGDEETFPQLSERLSVLSAAAICEAVSLIESNGVLGQVQDNTKACKAPKLVKSEGRIDWNMPARTLFNKIRAFIPFPGTWAFLNNERLVVEQAALIDMNDSSGEPGSVLAVTENGFDVQCGLGSIRILRVKPEGRNSMTGRDFANGRNLQKGTKLT